MIKITCDECGKEIKTLDISKQTKYTQGGIKLVEYLEVNLGESVEVRNGKILCANCDKHFGEYDKGN